MAGKGRVFLMGGFFLICKSQARNDNSQFHALTTCFTRIGFGRPDIITYEDCVFAGYGNFQETAPKLLRYPNGDFVFVSGTCISSGGAQLAAAKQLYDAADKLSVLDQLFGHYAVVIRQNAATNIFIDRFGGYHLYYNKEAGMVSTSFYAMASALRRLTIISQSVFEYVINGVISGDETLFDEIRLVPIGAKLMVRGGTLQVSSLPLFIPNSTKSQDLRGSLAQSIGILDQSFAKVIRTFGDRVGTALSGGYDSRLILALLRRHGVQRPRLYVYGREPDKDVQLAGRIAAGEGLPIAIIDKDAVEQIPPAMFAHTAHANFLALDGYGYPGIFNNGSEVKESARRVAGNLIAFNGGGGEIFRNFFYLRDRRYTIRELLWTFYSQFDPTSMTSRFQPEIYYQHLERKIRALVGDNADPALPRPTTEWLYHSFRCRAWDGKVDSISNWFGYTAMPFLERQITEHASTLPLCWKNHGAYEAELIRSIDVRLAAYPSVYGHPFNRAPPFGRRLRDYATHFRPPWLRRLSYRIKHSWSQPPSQWHGYLAPEYVRVVLPDGPDFLHRLFHLSAAKDAHQYARILSLEYAFRQFGTRVNLDFLEAPSTTSFFERLAPL